VVKYWWLAIDNLCSFLTCLSMMHPASAADSPFHILMTLTPVAWSVQILLQSKQVVLDILQLMYVLDTFLHYLQISNLAQVQPQCMGCGVYYPELKGHCGRCKGCMGPSEGSLLIVRFYKLYSQKPNRQWSRPSSYCQVSRWACSHRIKILVKPEWRPS